MNVSSLLFTVAKKKKRTISFSREQNMFEKSFSKYDVSFLEAAHEGFMEDVDG